MVFQYLLAQGTHVDMGVDFRRSYRFVTQHGLNDAQVGSAFQECCGKGVSKRVGRNGFGDASLNSLLLDHNKYHGTREVCSATIEEHVVFLSGLDFHEVTVHKPVVQFLDGFGRDGHQAFLGTLAEDADVLFFQVEVAEFQVYQFADAQTTAEQYLDDGTIALAFPL